VVKDEIDIGACHAARVEVANVALYEVESVSVVGMRGKRFVDVRSVASRKVVEANNCLPKSQELFEYVRTDEAADTGNEPTPRPLGKAIENVSVVGSAHVLTMEGDGRNSAWHLYERHRPWRERGAVRPTSLDDHAKHLPFPCHVTEGSP
jgi:hypothetical protein